MTVRRLAMTTLCLALAAATGCSSDSGTDAEHVKATGPIDVTIEPRQGHVAIGATAVVVASVAGPRAADAKLSVVASGVATVSGNAPTFRVGASGTGTGEVTFRATDGANTDVEHAYVSADDHDIFWDRASAKAPSELLLDARLARGAITAEQHRDQLEELRGGSGTTTTTTTTTK